MQYVCLSQLLSISETRIRAMLNMQVERVLWLSVRALNLNPYPSN